MDTPYKKSCELGIGESYVYKTGIASLSSNKRNAITNKTMLTDEPAADGNIEGDDTNRNHSSPKPMQWAAIKSALMESS